MPSTRAAVRRMQREWREGGFLESREATDLYNKQQYYMYAASVIIKQTNPVELPKRKGLLDPLYDGIRGVDIERRRESMITIPEDFEEEAAQLGIDSGIVLLAESKGARYTPYPLGLHSVLPSIRVTTIGLDKVNSEGLRSHVIDMTTSSVPGWRDEEHSAPGSEQLNEFGQTLALIAKMEGIEHELAYRGLHYQLS